MPESYSRTTSYCAKCRTQIDADIIADAGRVYLEKRCPVHGRSRGLICSDENWYRESLSYIKPMTEPKRRAVTKFCGCPDSCGLCPEHGQHTCLPVFEILSGCDLTCPVCLKNWKNEFSVTMNEYATVIDMLLRTEGAVPILNLSGGEPTLHPDLPEMLSLARERGVMQTSVSTNGLRLLADEAFRHRIRAYDPVIALQFDGFSPETWRSLRGEDLSEQKLRLIEILEAEGFKYSLVAVVASGVNDHEVRAITDFFFEHKALSLMFQPLAHTGAAGALRNPEHRITIPDIVHAAEGSRFVKPGDFNPLPCSHPTCFALSYYFKADQDRYISLKEWMGLDAYLDVISNRTLPGLDIEGFERLKNRVYDIWSAGDQYPDAEVILRKMRAVLREMNENGFDPQKAFDLGSRDIKAVFIHQFMDADTLDLSRLMKCCNHYPQTDGRLIPMCAQNVLR